MGEGLRERDVPRDRLLEPVLLEHLRGPRVHGEDRPEVRVPYALEYAPQVLLDVRVARPVDGQKHVFPFLELELVEHLGVLLRRCAAHVEGVEHDVPHDVHSLREPVQLQVVLRRLGGAEQERGDVVGEHP